MTFGRESDTLPVNLRKFNRKQFTDDIQTFNCCKAIIGKFPVSPVALLAILLYNNARTFFLIPSLNISIFSCSSVIWSEFSNLKFF